MPLNRSPKANSNALSNERFVSGCGWDADSLRVTQGSQIFVHRSPNPPPTIFTKRPALISPISGTPLDHQLPTCLVMLREEEGLLATIAGLHDMVWNA